MAAVSAKVAPADPMAAMAAMAKMAPPAEEKVAAVRKVWTGHTTPKSIGNTRFPGPLESLPYPSTAPSVPGAFERLYSDGYVIFPSVLNAAEVAELRARIDTMGKPDAEYDVKNWCFNKHIGLDFRTDAPMLQYIDKANIADVADAILGGAYAVCGSVWVTGKGREMGIHIDHLPVPMPEDVLRDPRVRTPIFAATAHYYLNDMAPELGPTLIVPRSHRAGRPPADESSWNGTAPKAALVKAGDVVLFRSDIWHGAWKNTSEQRRYIVQIHYQSKGFFSAYGPPRAKFKYSDAVMASATERQKQLLAPHIY